MPTPSARRAPRASATRCVRPSSRPWRRGSGGGTGRRAGGPAWGGAPPGVPPGGVAWRRWARVLWRRASERPHRWNCWSSLPERDLAGDDLEGAVVLGGRLEGVIGRGGRWRNGNFAASTVDDGDFEGADLAGTSLARAA